MSYELFKKQVLATIERAGGNIGVDFEHTEDGRHVARCSDGVVLTSNSYSNRVQVNGFNFKSVAVLKG